MHHFRTCLKLNFGIEKEEEKYIIYQGVNIFLILIESFCPIFLSFIIKHYMMVNVPQRYITPPKKIICHIISIIILISHYQSTSGGDLSMFSPLHAGFEPTLAQCGLEGVLYHMILYAYVL